MIKFFFLILFVILSLNAIKKIYFEEKNNINIFSFLLNFEIDNLYIYLIIFFLLHLMTKFIKPYLVKRMEKLKYKI